MKTLETARLILRPFAGDDLEDLYAYAQKPEIGPAAGWQPHGDRDESRRILGFFMSPDAKDEVRAIVLRETGRVVGSLGVSHDGKRASNPGAYEVGYVLDSAHWGQGIMPEAVRAVMSYYFDERGADIISAYHYPHNAQSGRVMQKCGMTREGVLRHATIIFNGEMMDHVCYAITREEYLRL